MVRIAVRNRIGLGTLLDAGLIGDEGVTAVDTGCAISVIDDSTVRSWNALLAWETVFASRAVFASGTRFAVGTYCAVLFIVDGDGRAIIAGDSEGSIEIIGSNPRRTRLALPSGDGEQ
ncbi:MAG: hypothetical protein ACJAZO_002502 [Myxococcota bacterium]|jgi:hypothetical protein